jgi:hypothetical protein
MVISKRAQDLAFALAAAVLVAGCSPAARRAPVPEPPTASPGAEPVDEVAAADAGGASAKESPPVAPAPEPAPVEAPAMPEAGPALRIPAADFARATVPIEDPQRSMEHFYRRLEAVARGEAGALARLAVFGDSSNGADFITSAVRRALQLRFGDGGKGYLPIAPGWPTQFHQDVTWQHRREWLTQVVNRGAGPGGRYGLAGVLATNRTARSSALFGTVRDGPVGRSVSRFRLFYQAWPRGGAVQMAVDGGAPVVVETAAEAMDDRVYEIDVPDGPHALEVGVARGQLRLYGVVMERGGPGVVVDGLMLVGARGRRLAHFDAAHFARQVAQRGPDLLVFWLGGNDAQSEYFERAGFVAEYGAGIEHARAGRPEASCLVVSITDLGSGPEGRPRRRAAPIVDAQREIALARGCAFLDFFRATGGEGGMRAWSRRGLVSGDYLHFTPPGARDIGQLFYETVLRGFDEHLARNGAR